MSSNETNYRRTLANSAELRRAFHEHRTELEWVAYFMTGDRNVAAACVTDACGSAECHNGVFEEWVATWVRYATIRSAVDMKRDVIKHVARSYKSCCSIGISHHSLEGELFEFLVQRSELFIQKLDVICRCTLVICGIQRSSMHEAAAMLGISRSTAEAAYLTAIDYLETAWLEHLGNEQICSAIWNPEARFTVQ